MRRPSTGKRSRIIKQMMDNDSFKHDEVVVSSTSIASGEIGGEIVASSVSASIPVGDEGDDNYKDDGIAPVKSNLLSHLESKYAEYGGIEEQIIVFPKSTHSWLFTEEIFSMPFWFAIGIVALSYCCLILALINLLGQPEEGNRLGVPYQVGPTVRIAQYMAMIIALIMEEEIPTGLYLLRMITQDSFHNKFPMMKFTKFVFAALVRLVMGYLFLFNTFVVVVQATEVLDIFYDVLALQFLQQLDDISFNLAKTDVFGRGMKHAALSKCFSAQFEKQPFALRRRMHFFLKAIYFLNMCALFSGLAYVTVQQERGAYYSDSITVTFGDQICKDAIVITDSGEMVPKTLLFSYFSGIYRRQDETHDGRPIYTEQNKFDGLPYKKTTSAEIKYCHEERAWVFGHPNIRKSSIDESGCPWLLKSPETTEYNLLDVTGDWTIWTGSVSHNGHLSAIDNTCKNLVDCNFHGDCVDGVCECFEDEGNNDKFVYDNLYYGLHCEHKQPCSLISGGDGGIWAQVKWADTKEFRMYQRPVYRYERGLPQEVLDMDNVDSDEDNMYLVFTGSRWFGTLYRSTKRASLPRSFWEEYCGEYHAFWYDLYNTRTLFASEPTSQSSIMGVDMYMLGKMGDEFGEFGQLFPLSDPKGSGWMRCVEDEIENFSEDLDFLKSVVDFNDDEVGTVVVEFELRKGRDYETDALAKDCKGNLTNIDLDVLVTRTPKFMTHDLLSLKYSVNKSQLEASNIWNQELGKIEFCQAVRVVILADGSSSKRVVLEEFNVISGQ